MQHLCSYHSCSQKEFRHRKKTLFLACKAPKRLLPIEREQPAAFCVACSLWRRCDYLSPRAIGDTINHRTIKGVPWQWASPTCMSGDWAGTDPSARVLFRTRSVEWSHIECTTSSTSWHVSQPIPTAETRPAPSHNSLRLNRLDFSFPNILVDVIKESVPSIQREWIFLKTATANLGTRHRALSQMSKQPCHEEYKG